MSEVALYFGVVPYGGPRGVGVSYERGNPLPQPLHNSPPPPHTGWEFSYERGTADLTTLSTQFAAPLTL